MAFIQLLTSLWPFFKEMFFGDKLKDQESSKDRAGGNTPEDRQSDSFVVRILRGCVTKMQKSKRFLATVLLVLIFSIFLNYKLIDKQIKAVPPREDEQVKSRTPDLEDQKELPTIPRKEGETEVVLKKTVEELELLYGEKK